MKYFDNTRLADYKSCPRKYFLRHILNWTPSAERTAPALVFGGAWHEGVDVIWGQAKQIGLQNVVQSAYEAFLKYWTDHEFPDVVSIEMMDEFGARTPMTAKEMFYNYVVKNAAIIHNAEVESIEKPFAIPLPGLDNVFYIGRMDKVIKLNSRRTVIEHKTTSLYRIQGGFDPQYLDSWWTSSQVKGYLFGGTMLYGEVHDAWVDCALVHKKVHDAFRFVPISHGTDIIKEWIVTTATWSKEVIEATKRWEGGESVLSTFKKNEDSCYGKYGPCPFIDICRIHADPTKLDGPPPGFEVKKWEPFTEDDLQNIINNK